VLDADHHRAILFGGLSGVTFTQLNDLWEFDLGTSTWRSLSIADDTLITPRSSHGAAVIGDSLLVFGGETGLAETLLQDYFMLDLATGTWRLGILPDLPVSRMPVATYGGTVYAYGGREPGGPADPAAVSNRLRTFETTQGMWDWQSFTAPTSPQRRVGAALAVAVESAQLFLFGGVGTALQDLPSDSSWFLAATPQVQPWEKVPGYGSDPRQSPPPPLWKTCAVYDSLENRILVWGGQDLRGNLPTELWEFSLGARVWQQVPTTGAEVPAGRVTHQMVMDAPNRRVIVFGGNVSGLGTDELWELDLDPGP
jgi:hypothetical protein